MMSAPRPSAAVLYRHESRPASDPHPALDSYEVVYEDSGGLPMLGFVHGQWYDVSTLRPIPVSVRAALRRDPAWAGAVVQTLCQWMRAHPAEERSFELATELALAVGELARGR